MQRTLRCDPIQVSQWKRQLLDGASELFIWCKQTKDKDEGQDQVWATDITYIPMRKGFLYLVAIVDFFSRNRLSWKLSNSLDAEFCREALEIPLKSGRKPKIFHSDQGGVSIFNGFVPRAESRGCQQFRQSC
jgi:transposase InsO family protein